MPSHDLPSASTGARRVLIVGGGTAGITVAARLRRAGVTGVTLLDPSDTHWYQPLWTLVGGGQAPLRITWRPQATVIPPGVSWIRDAATAVDPEARRVTTAGGAELDYDLLVLAPGIQLNWQAVPGLADAVGRDVVTSNYSSAYAPRTWELIRSMRSGTAVFTQPSGPFKCGGAPQKIAYLAADYWRRKGCLKDIRIILVIPDAAIFKAAPWVPLLDRVAARYGIEVRLRSELVALDPARREATIAGDTGKEVVRYDLLHAVPPQSAPDWIKQSTPLADPSGYLEVDRHTLAHPRHPEIFALGDAAGLPTSKTGAAIRKQAPVVVENLLAAMHGRPATARYDGYTSCPLVTARDRMLLAEFDYDQRPTPTIPFIDTMKERRDMWLLKRYGLPAMYWHGMLKGRA